MPHLPPVQVAHPAVQVAQLAVQVALGLRRGTIPHNFPSLMSSHTRLDDDQPLCKSGGRPGNRMGKRKVRR